MFSSNTSQVSSAANYIEDVFSTWLYTGNGSTQTITNGIDLSTKGGLVWLKSRSNVSRPELVDTARGTNSALYTNGPDAAGTNPSVYNFLSSGFQVGVGVGWGNENAYTYASWTFRKQPKFFDVVTWTGDGTSNRAISHSLGSAPGCIIAKRTDAVGNWNVYHRGVSPANDNTLTLNTTSSASGGGQDIWGNGVNVTTPTTTSFYVAGQNNNNGVNYVAYLFAHNAGGFGLTGTDNVISCGSWTGTPFNINLGWEPQWVLIKKTNGTGGWLMFDTMRGWDTSGVVGGTQLLQANTSGAEGATGLTTWQPNATGFSGNANLDDTYIYIAIRRGPMKTPTTGTSVFYPRQPFGNATVTGGFAVDTIWANRLTSNTDNTAIADRLRGSVYFSTSQTYAEGSDTTISFASNTSSIWTNFSVGVRYNFARAPGFYDVLCYTGTGSARAQAHNLGVVPELIITVSRDPGSNWQVYYDMGGSTFSRATINTTAAATTGISYGGSANLNSAPTASNINLSSVFPNSIEPMAMYLFASCPGVSKVFSFTGNGSSQTINCGFTGGSRLVLIKRTDSTGNWVIFDSARGIVAGNDPALYLNSTAAEVTGVDAVDTDSTGFIVNQETTFNLNVNNATYIGLAIA